MAAILAVVNMRPRYLICILTFVVLLHTASCTSYIQPPLDQYIPDAGYIIYYDIRGSTEGDLIQQMNRLGPIGLDGKKHWGYCEWESGGGDDPLAIKVTMPRWAPPNDADPDLIAEWDNVVKNLAKHENGHARIVRANAGPPNIIQQLSDAYDAKTNHGVKQGVSFDDGKRIPYDPIDPFVEEILSNDASIPSLPPRKPVAERFAELNRMRKNNTAG